MVEFIIDRPLVLVGTIILIWAFMNSFYFYFITKKTPKDTTALINRYLTYKLIKRYNAREYEAMTKDLNNRHL